MEIVEFTELFERYKDIAERCIYRKIANIHDAEDVIGDVFAEAVKSYASIENSERFKSWLLAIASHRCNDYYRRKSRSRDVPVDNSDMFMSKSGRLDRTSMIVRETVAEMDLTDRNMLSMYYYEEMSVREISEMLKIPEGTVKSRLYKARERFKEIFPYKAYKPMTETKIRKGEKIMYNFPEIISNVKITKKNAPVPEIRCEETNGWFIIPKLGGCGAWASYDYPERKHTSTCSWKASKAVKIHGVEGIEFTSDEIVHDAAADEEYSRKFVIQLTDTHIRSLMESHVRNGVEEITTFLDENFLANWGEGENNCGMEINLKDKGNIKVSDDGINPMQITADMKRNDEYNLCGRYEVTIGNRTYDTALLVTFHQDDKVMTLRYLDLADKANSKTVLWRRYNSDDWAMKTYKQNWSEKFPTNDKVYINGELYVHWYDCISDYVL